MPDMLPPANDLPKPHDSAPSTIPPTAMPVTIHTHVLANGLTLLCQPMPWVSSAALSLLIPAGAATDPLGAGGTAGLATEWAIRGAGDRDNRALSDYLDGLGLQRGQGATRQIVSFDGVLLGRQLPAALRAYADIVLRPRLDTTEFEQARELALQELEASEDQPTVKWSRELGHRCWPFPYSRPADGTTSEVAALTAAGVADDLRRRWQPRGAILAVAGQVDWPALVETVQSLWGDWDGQPSLLPTGEDTRRRISHLTEATEQTHIGLVCPALPFGHPRYYDQAVAMRVLSGGMGARLFTEVREKRSLCYSVSASISTIRGQSLMVAYANPNPPKALEAAEVLLAELRRVCRQGVTADEIARAKVAAKSGLVFSGESTRSRAVALVNDYFYLGRVRAMEEVAAAIEAVSVASVNTMLAEHPFAGFTLVTLGPAALSLTEADLA